MHRLGRQMFQKGIADGLVRKERNGDRPSRSISRLPWVRTSALVMVRALFQYKTGEPVKPGDEVSWESNGAGNFVQHKGIVLALVFAGSSIKNAIPFSIHCKVVDKHISPLNRNILDRSKMDRVLVLVQASGYRMARTRKKPKLMAPLPGSLKLVRRGVGDGYECLHR